MVFLQLVLVKDIILWLAFSFSIKDHFRECTRAHCAIRIWTVIFDSHFLRLLQLKWQSLELDQLSRCGLSLEVHVISFDNLLQLIDKLRITANSTLRVMIIPSQINPWRTSISRFRPHM